MTFEDLQLDSKILQAIEECGHSIPTPVQEQAIPKALTGRDLIASAQTGTGKTAAFVLPALQRLCEQGPDREPGLRILVVTPTRELAVQITQVTRAYGQHLDIHSVAIYGGMPMGDQVRALAQLPDMIIGTPGRLIDHIWRGRIGLSKVEMLVFDEADRMLDMGFIDDVEFISDTVPEECQRLLFAATMNEETTRLAEKFLKNPDRVEVAPGVITHEKIEQRLYMTSNLEHKHRLLSAFCSDPDVTRAIIFAGTKRDAEKLARALNAQGHPAAPLHADMTQAARNNTIKNMRQGKIRLLVATDVAARGIDITGISHVVNFDLPRSPEDYVNRIGRTGRAGEAGIAISFASRADLPYLARIERYLGAKIPVQSDADVPAESPAAQKQKSEKRDEQKRDEQKTSSRRGRSRGRGRRSRGGGAQAPAAAEMIEATTVATAGDEALLAAPETAEATLELASIPVTEASIADAAPTEPFEAEEAPEAAQPTKSKSSRKRRSRGKKAQPEAPAEVILNIFGMPRYYRPQGAPKKAPSSD
ncbi:MAG: DEAD/DEAH box helicase [Syntrophobacteraceae bacterium]